MVGERMSQSPEDCISRVEQMVADNGQTWDLSPNDKEALRYVLSRIETVDDLTERNE